MIISKKANILKVPSLFSSITGQKVSQWFFPTLIEYREMRYLNCAPHTPTHSPVGEKYNGKIMTYFQQFFPHLHRVMGNKLAQMVLYNLDRIKGNEISHLPLSPPKKEQ